MDGALSSQRATVMLCPDCCCFAPPHTHVRPITPASPPTHRRKLRNTNTKGAEYFVSELVKAMSAHGMDISPEARRPPILLADMIPANRQRVDDATYARNALTAARDAARCGLVMSSHVSYRLISSHLISPGLKPFLYVYIGACLNSPNRSVVHSRREVSWRPPPPANIEIYPFTANSKCVVFVPDWAVQSVGVKSSTESPPRLQK